MMDFSGINWRQAEWNIVLSVGCLCVAGVAWTRTKHCYMTPWLPSLSPPCHHTNTMSIYSSLIFYLGAVSCQLELPKCWIHYGECLDDNQPPLNIKDIVKPLPNENVIRIEQGVETIEDCKNKREGFSACTYYTLYKNDLNKNCQIVSQQV